MPLTTTITPANIAVALGVSAPESGSPTEAQWEMWIADALMLIQVRVDSLDPDPTVDQARLDYVIRQAVATRADRPKGGATQVTIAVDDASESTTYPRPSRVIDVEISDEWWALLGLNPTSGGAFDVDTLASATVHMPWCALNFGALYCSCGADIAGYPIYELGY